MLCACFVRLALLGKKVWKDVMGLNKLTMGLKYWRDYFRVRVINSVKQGGVVCLSFILLLRCTALLWNVWTDINEEVDILFPVIFPKNVYHKFWLLEFKCRALCWLPERKIFKSILHIGWCHGKFWLWIHSFLAFCRTASISTPTLQHLALQHFSLMEKKRFTTT